MEGKDRCPTAAERAAVTIAAAAEAAAAEQAGAFKEAADEAEGGVRKECDEGAPLLGPPAAAGDTEKLDAEKGLDTGVGGLPGNLLEEKKARAQRSVSPVAFTKRLAPSTGKWSGSFTDGYAGDFSALGKAPSRACQWLRCLPVLFLMLLVLYLNVVYVAYHCLPQLQLGIPAFRRDIHKFTKGSYDLIGFSALSFLFLLSYWLAVTTPAGAIPKTEEWELREEDPSKPSLSGPIETKRGGGRRACKWCCQRKPDRTHHCRVCRSCVLKMDHHCPWIFNCVGWGNHKFFMLSLVWGTVLGLFVAITMLPSVHTAITNEQTSFERVFMLLFAETLDIFLCILISGFLVFHSYLVISAVTTIEFCEKQFKKTPFDSTPDVAWSRGFRKNFTDAFGPEPLLWFFPVDNRSGNGTSFVARAPLYYDKDNLEKSLTKTLSASRRYKGFEPVVDQSS